MDPVLNVSPAPGNASQAGPSATDSGMNPGASQSQRETPSEYRWRLLQFRRRERRQRLQNPPHLQPSRRRRSQRRVRQPDEATVDINPFWPDLVGALRRRRSGQPTGSVKCMICGDAHLIIDGIEGPRDAADLEAAGITQECGVLAACGHIFGEDCLENWRRMRGRQHEPFSCPFCRFDLDPPRCSDHEVRWPRTLHWEGGRNFWLLRNNRQPSGDPHRAAAERCPDCRAEAGLVESVSPPPADVHHTPVIHSPPVNQSADGNPNDSVVLVQDETPPHPDRETSTLELDIADLEGSRERVWDFILMLHNRELEMRGERPGGNN